MKTNLLALFTFLSFQFLSATPVVPTIPAYTVCDSNNDGFEVFDLTSLSNGIAEAAGSSSYTVGYYETLVNANAGLNSLLGLYSNLFAWNQTIYFRVTDTSDNSFAVGSFQLVVNPKPIPGLVNDYQLCDLDGNGFASFNLVSLITEILNGNDPLSHTVTFYTSQFNANVAQSPITPINAYAGTNGQTIWVRIANNATGCYNVTSFNLVVNALPQSIQPNYPQYSLCDYNQSSLGYETFDLSSMSSSILLGQTGMNVTFYSSLGDAQNNTRLITNPSNYVNEYQYIQTLGIRITNAVTGCYVISTMDIRVEQLPMLIPPVGPYVICDNDNDGYGLFDFTPVLPDLLQGANYNITYHTTVEDAEAGVSDLGTPIENSVPYNQTIYLRAQSPTTQCYSVTPVVLEVHGSPQINQPSGNEACDSDFNNVESFDLTMKIPEILGSLNPDDYTVSFYHNLDEAEQGVNAIIPMNNYVGVFGEVLSVRVEDNVSHCTSFVYSQLIINTPLELTTPTPLQVCDDDASPNDQIHVFDLTVKDNEIAQGTGYTVTYYPSYLNAQANTNPIADPTAYTNLVPAVETVGVAVTTPGGCRSVTLLDIRVLPIPTPNTNPPALAPQCDVNDPGDMMEVFDLTVNAAYIINGDPYLALHYFITQNDAENNVNELMSTASALVGNNVWIRVENTRVDYQGNHCYVLVEQPLRVNPLPTVELISNNTLNTVYVDGNNTVVQPLTLDAQLNGNYTFQWNVDGVPITGANSSTYSVNTASSAGQTRVFSVTAEDLVTGCSSEDSITVNQSPGVPSPIGLVSQIFNEGDTLADLTVAGSDILWYASAANKNGNSMFSTPLSLNTLLIDGTTYYASQTIGGIESIARLPVTVHALLATPENEKLSLQYAPNPVKNSLTLHSSVILKSILVYTMTGQKVFEQKCNDMDLTIDLSRLSAGNYILKAQDETDQKAIRIIKE